MSRICGYARTVSGRPCANIVADAHDRCAAQHPSWTERVSTNKDVSEIRANGAIFEVDDLVLAKPPLVARDIDFSPIDEACRSASVGKLLPAALYVVCGTV